MVAVQLVRLLLAKCKVVILIWHKKAYIICKAAREPVSLLMHENCGANTLSSVVLEVLVHLQKNICRIVLIQDNENILSRHLTEVLALILPICRVTEHT